MPFVMFKDRWTFIALKDDNQIYVMIFSDQANQHVREDFALKSTAFSLN